MTPSAPWTRIVRVPLMPTVRRADSSKTGGWPDHPRARRALAASHSPRSRCVAGVAPKPQGAVLEARAQRDLHYAVLDVERVPVLDAPQLDGPGADRRMPAYSSNNVDVSNELDVPVVAQMIADPPLADPPLADRSRRTTTPTRCTPTTTACRCPSPHRPRLRLVDRRTT